MATTPPRGAKVARNCLNCKGLFTARVADVKRGWGLYCSKSCKAARQEGRTQQFSHYQQAQDDYGEPHRGGECFPSHAEGEVQ